MHFRGSIASPGTGNVDAGKHDGKITAWMYGFYIRSDVTSFVRQLAHEIFSISDDYRQIPWVDVSTRLGALKQGITGQMNQARSNRQALQADLKARQEDWVFNPASGSNPTYSPSPYSPIAGLTTPIPRKVTLAYPSTSGFAAFTLCPYRFDADGWLIECGTEGDLPPRPGKQTVPHQWMPGFNGWSQQQFNASPNDPNNWNGILYGDASEIFPRAEQYSIVRALEYGIGCRIDAIDAILSSINKSDYVTLKQVADSYANTLDSHNVPYDFWVVNESPISVIYENFLLGLNPITLPPGVTQDIKITTGDGTVLPVHVDVPFTPPPAALTQDAAGNIFQSVSAKYSGLNSLQAFQKGADYSLTRFTQPQTLTKVDAPGKSSYAGIVVLALGAVAVYLSVKK